MRNMSVALVKHKRITTTVEKAKELRSFIEPLITKARKADLHNQRLVMESLKDKEVVKEMFSGVIEKIGDRKGGYTRIVRLGRRKGDGANVAIIELVDYNAVMNEQAQERKKEKDVKKEAKAKAKAESTPPQTS
jgi:large subunit ribosomal protein L17